MKVGFGLGLHALRRLVEHIRSCMHPAALPSGFGKDFPHSGPEAECTVADGVFFLARGGPLNDFSTAGYAAVFVLHVDTTFDDPSPAEDGA